MKLSRTLQGWASRGYEFPFGQFSMHSTEQNDATQQVIRKWSSIDCGFKTDENFRCERNTVYRFPECRTLSLGAQVPYKGNPFRLAHHLYVLTNHQAPILQAWVESLQAVVCETLQIQMQSFKSAIVFKGLPLITGSDPIFRYTCLPAVRKVMLTRKGYNLAVSPLERPW